MRTRRNGWVVTAPAGGFPFPFEWQAWAMAAGRLVSLLAGFWLPAALAGLLGIGVSIEYIGASLWMMDDRAD